MTRASDDSYGSENCVRPDGAARSTELAPSADLQPRHLPRMLMLLMRMVLMLAMLMTMLMMLVLVVSRSRPALGKLLELVVLPR